MKQFLSTDFGLALYVFALLMLALVVMSVLQYYVYSYPNDVSLSPVQSDMLQANVSVVMLGSFLSGIFVASMVTVVKRWRTT